MGVDGGVTSGTSQVLVLSVGNVEVGLRVPVLLGETKIDDIDLVAALADSHQEVVRLDVTVDEVTGVDVLDARDLSDESASGTFGGMSGLITYQLISE